MALITQAVAKTYLGLTDTDATRDAVITELCSAATQAMERWCGRHLDSTAVTEILDGTGKEGVWLKEPPETMTSVKEDADQAWATATSLVENTDYMVRGCKLERLDSVWLDAVACIQAVYVGGFAAPATDLTLACRVQVAKLYAEWQAAKQGLNILSSHNVQGWAQTFLVRGGLDPYVKDVLELYRPQRL